MIEMSVDSKTVLPPGGHREPPGHAEPAGNCEVAEGAVAEGPVPPRPAASGDLAECPTQIELGAGGGPGPGGDGKGAVPLWKQQQPAAAVPAVGQLRQNKRRHTAGCGFKQPGAGKRRRRANSESDPPVLPSNFLLGGNIFDPLNLNSLLDEEVNRAINAETPESSPLPARSRDPVEILVPRDITDPLNLNSDGEPLLSPQQGGGGGGGRRRHRNRHHGGGGGARGGGVATAAQPHLLGSEGGQSFPAQPSLPPSLPAVVPDNSREGAASPVLPPCSSAPFPRTPLTASGPTPVTPAVAQQHNKRRSDPSAALPGVPHKKGRDPGPGGRAWGQPHPQGQRRPAHHHQRKKFQYGNYNKYYGYRNPGCSEDPRVRVMAPEWFRGKHVLDLGCNTGHLTLFIARNWHPARIVGLDIDGGLVHAARQNVRHYLSDMLAQETRGRDPGCGDEEGRGLAKGAEPSSRGARVAEERRRSQDKGAELSTQGKEDRLGEGGAEERRRNQDKGAEPSTQPEGDRRGEGGAEERRRSQEESAALALKDDGANSRSGDCGNSNGCGVESEADPTAPPAGAAEGDSLFPVSLRISRGPIAAPPLPETPDTPPGDFPANVSFVKGNYVLESDSLLSAQRAEYDVILCLSISKWVHLNWGDVGLQRFFKRVYSHLHPGGVFILEPQPWSSYGRRRKLTDTIYKNYHSIRLKPQQFCSYLTSEVGFTSYELLGTPKSTSRGFERPIYKFYKGPSCLRK